MADSDGDAVKNEYWESGEMVFSGIKRARPAEPGVFDFAGVFRFIVCRLLLVYPLTLCSAWAGNLQITNIQSGGINYAAGTSEVRFDISWENSWRLSAAPGNWDAVWVLVKFRKNGGAWEHASLENTGHSVPSGMTVSTGLSNMTYGAGGFNIYLNPGVGVFLYRSNEGTGNRSLSNVRLQWNLVSKWRGGRRHD